MSLNLFLTPGTAPSGTPLPGNAQALLNFISAYTGIAGQDSFNGINYGPDTPSPENRAYPWFKTDDTGNPIGLYSWNGSAWIPIPSIVASGTTAQRPLNPSLGTKFFDTSINVELIFYGGQWSTAAGSPGDIKYTAAISVAAALTANPGWIEFEAARGRAMIGAGQGNGLTDRTIGQSLGEENHVLAVNELAAHVHANTKPALTPFTTAGGGFASNGVVSVGNSDSTGNSDGHNTMQPSYVAVCLIKQ